MNTILSVMVGLALHATPPSNISFDQALSQKQITVRAEASDNSSHYQQPVMLFIKNITASPLNVELPVGRYFEASDSTDQDFVSTEPILFALAPGQTLPIEVPAMCVAHDKSAPAAGKAYFVKKQANDKLSKTAKYIQDNKLSGTYLGQTMMWCVSDNQSLETVFSYNDTQVPDALKFLASLLGKPVPPPPAADDYMRNSRAEPKIKIGGSFSFRFSSPKAVHVAMFDKQNIAVRELYNNPNEPAGSRKVNFEFDGSVYNNNTYYIRFMVDNHVLMEKEMRI